jgi:hypothetical protein
MFAGDGVEGAPNELGVCQIVCRASMTTTYQQKELGCPLRAVPMLLRGAPARSALLVVAQRRPAGGNRLEFGAWLGLSPKGLSRAVTMGAVDRPCGASDSTSACPTGASRYNLRQASIRLVYSNCRGTSTDSMLTGEGCGVGGSSKLRLKIGRSAVRPRPWPPHR